jgi:hypothetical protein
MTSSIGGTSGFSSASLAQMREQMFQKLDADGSGGIDETEFANGPSGSGGMDSGIASALFSAFDADSDGSLTQDELETGFQKLSSSMRSVLIGTQEAGSAGGAGGPGGPGGPDGPPPPPPQDSADGSSDSSSDSSLDMLLSLLQNITSTDSSTSSDSSDSDSGSATTAVQNDFKQLMSDLQKLVASSGTTASTSVTA